MAGKLRFNCSNCKLSETRFSVVQGRGSVPAEIMFLGEAPGKMEDLKGLAFIGKAGQLLNFMLGDAIVLLKNEENKSIKLPSFFITNTVLCRPTDYVLGPNRQPKPLEILACRENILNLYDKVSPKLVVFLGKIAKDYYSKEFRESIHITHPAALLRQGGRRSVMYKPNVRKLAEIFNGW